MLSRTTTEVLPIGVDPFAGSGAHRCNLAEYIRPIKTSTIEPSIIPDEKTKPSSPNRRLRSFWHNAAMPSPAAMRLTAHRNISVSPTSIWPGYVCPRWSRPAFKKLATANNPSVRQPAAIEMANDAIPSAECFSSTAGIGLGGRTGCRGCPSTAQANASSECSLPQ